MPSNIPRKKRCAVANSREAITTTVLAIADAKQRGHGINLETSFPGGRMHVMIGEITITCGGKPNEG